MTGADRGSLTNASGIGRLSSNADSYVALALVAGQSVPLTYLAYFSCRKASIAYWEHDGWYLHVAGKSTPSV